MSHISNVLLYRNGQILLGKRSPHRRTYPNCWALFGGHLEGGETPDQAEAMQLPDLALDEYRSAFQQALPLIRQSL
ncbi:NUDIX domain-containing protein [Pseudochrobactrum asaccharolyticum]|uniref:NUDIX domain-containing protein n=1 Tax=Pseudochrobactrum asaccharolyticum TaxID=354351 RepID=A0A366DXW8_9HYPH|nr:NUDIX domain-containing protein [Pseudochrobactrum asaccharolyticum]RBO94897.1 NUDIX domain-containing protein [Pseudochrobactrum asaccharolyticum]